MYVKEVLHHWITLPFGLPVFIEMFIKVFLSSTLLSMCNGFTLNHGISAIKFHRDDNIPHYTACNHRKVHINKMEESNNYNPDAITRNRRFPESYANLQYAPLLLSYRKEQTTEDVSTQQTTEETFRKTKFPQNINRKKYLIEPLSVDHTSHSEKPETLQTVISGHNIAVHPKTNLDDTDTSTSPTFINSFKQNEEGLKKHETSHSFFLKPVHYQKEKSLLPSILNSLERKEPSRSSNIQNVLTEQIVYKPVNEDLRHYKELQSKHDAELQFAMSTFVKAPRVHLNVARSYNTAQFPYSPQLHILQSNTHNAVNGKQTLFRQNSRGAVEMKTFLHPLYYSNSYMIRRSGT